MITASLQYLGGTSRVGTSPVDVIAKWEFVLFYLFICSGFTRDRTYFYTRLCGASGGGARMPKKSNDQQWLIYSWIFFFISQGHLLPEQQQKSACRVLTTGVISDGSLGLKKKKKTDIKPDIKLVARPCQSPWTTYADSQPRESCCKVSALCCKIEIKNC